MTTMSNAGHMGVLMSSIDGLDFSGLLGGGHHVREEQSINIS